MPLLIRFDCPPGELPYAVSVVLDQGGGRIAHAHGTYSARSANHAVNICAALARKKDPELAPAPVISSHATCLCDPVACVYLPAPP